MWQRTQNGHTLAKRAITTLLSLASKARGSIAENPAELICRKIQSSYLCNRKVPGRIVEAVA